GGRAGEVLARDVGGRAVHRLEHRRVGAGGVDVAAGRQADAAGDRGRQVGDDVAEQVVGDDHVEAARIGHQVHHRGVDVHVVGGDLRVLGGHLVHGALPQPAGVGQHVVLVHQGDVFAPGHRLVEGVAHHA